ncbi:MAG: DUF4340 domain-containing protein [Polyangiaceae bacterium]
MSARASATPIVLMALAAATAAYAYFVDRRGVSDADRAARHSDVFPSFRTEDVARITLVKGGEKLVLERATDAGADAWTMVVPRDERADGASVDAQLRELEMATKLRSVEPGSATGLDEPRVRGSVQMGAVEYRFALGADALRPEGAAYMELEGEGAFVVEHSLAVQLLRGADAYRDRTLVPYGASGVQRLVVRAPGGSSFDLVRRGAAFRLASRDLRASRSAVSHLLAIFADGRAERFLPDAAGDDALAHARETFTVSPRSPGDPTVELAIGGDCPGHPGEVVVVRTKPGRVCACASRSIVDDLPSDPGTLVDTSPFFAHADEIEELRLEPVGASGPRVELARRGSGWHERAPLDRDLAGDEVDAANSLAAALTGARASAVLPRAPAGRYTGRSRVTAVRTGGETPEIVEVGAPEPDGSILLHREDDGAFLRVTRATAARFEPHPIALRARSLWTTPFDPAAVTSLDDSCGPTTQRLERRDGGWALAIPPGLPADPVAASDLVAALANAKADSWVDETDRGFYGLGGSDACVVSIALSSTAGADSGSRHVSISLGASSGDETYARTSDDPGVFAASPSLRRLVSRPAIDGSRLRIDPGHLSSLAVLRGGRRREVSLDRGDDGALRAAIGSLYAEHAVHAGSPEEGEAMDRPTLEIAARARGDAAAEDTRITVGAATSIDGAAFYFARVSGTDATFAVPDACVAAILGAM